MPTKQPTTPDLEMHSKYHAKHRYYSELARLTTGLFVGVLALMALLLTVGLSHPDKAFKYFVYTSLILLPACLLAYAIGQAILQMMWSKKSETKADAKPDTKSAGKWRALKITRAIQQILFILAVISVAGLALATAHFFFAAQAQQQTQQTAPAQTQ